jgi:CRP-like cAMP-binding protein
MLMSVMFDRLRFIAARLAARNAAITARQHEGTVFDPALLAQLEGALGRPVITRFAQGANIMREGQAGACAYIVKTGRVAISIRESAVEVVNAGGTFGEMALVDQSPRTASATAETDCELLAIDRPSLLEALKQQPAFAMAMLRAIADRLRFMNSQLG